jgi:hypothetical protein
MTQAQLDRWIEELYAQWIAYLRGNWPRIRQRQQDEDVAQAVVVALHECRAWERFQGDPDNRPHVAGWLLGYVKHIAANWDRYQRRRQARPLFDTDLRIDPSAESGVPTRAELTRVPSTGRPGRSRVLSTPIEPPPPTLPPWRGSSREPVGGTRRERGQAKRRWAATLDELAAVDSENGESGEPWAEAAPIHTPAPRLHAKASEDAILERLEPTQDRLLSQVRDFIVPDLDGPMPAWSREFAKWHEWELRMLLVGWLDLRQAIRGGLAQRGKERADAEFVLELDEWFRTFCGFGAARAPKPSSDPGYRTLGGGYELGLPAVTRPQAENFVRAANGNAGALADALAAHYWGRTVGQIRGALRLASDSVNTSALPRASDLLRAVLAE